MSYKNNNTKPIISVKGLGKKYRIKPNANSKLSFFSNISLKLKYLINGDFSALIGNTEDFWAIKKISFTVNKGEALGMTGGISGKMLKEKSLNMLKKVNSLRNKNTTLISSGGVSSKNDVQERIKHGADLIQIYTSFIYKGPLILEELLN